MNYIREIFKQSILFLIVVIVLIPSLPAVATPPAHPPLPEAVTVYFAFLAGRGPDAEGNFEIEVYCKTNFPTKEIIVHIGYSEEIVIEHTEDTVLIERTLQLFKGKMAKGEVKTWHLRGVLLNNANFEKSEIPASLALRVKYQFPYQAFVRGIEQNSTLTTREREEMLEYIQREKGEKAHAIFRALPVLRGSQ
jgi:hypothetical protein